ncbi:AAA family ATPase [Flavobacterium oreochromis]|uniref:AAA family ATPase n=1 Tax=Flavobacterium oreochromis TaxID=2906078 RepID=UPI00385972D9
MLNSLNIKNYRSLKELKINSLGKVNLITGKNNTGKSTILEAIALYASKADLSSIYQFLGERGENFKQTESIKNPTDSNIKSFSSLFTNRVVGFENENIISIGASEDNTFNQQSSFEKTVSLRFVKYSDEILRDNQGNILTRKRTILDNSNEKENPIFKIGFETRTEDNSYILSLEEDKPYRYGYGYRNTSINQNEKFQFIRTRNIDREINGKLFDNIALTEKEQFVIDALKIIEQTTERIAFIEESSRERTAVIKLSGVQNILPLKSMGDGINRILTIILALVNCDNGYLLIDEFENGLHYSVQEQLWKIIFSLSEKLKIQIFATTHSEDCIRGFENILNRSDNALEGKLIRLDNINGIIKQVEYNANELKIATDQNIEIR